MQTKRQIRQLLSSAGLRPKKKLGQNFLIDLNMMRLFVESAKIQGSDVVLEVGCGTGSLTEELCRYAGEVIAVEIDLKLAEIAKLQLAGFENVSVIAADILKNKHTISGAVLEAIESARKEYGGRFLLVSNLPYNVASSVMLNLVVGPVAADDMHITVQKEVAERMTAEPGCKAYGPLSIFLSATGQAKTIKVLSPDVIWPRPQVESAMISFRRAEEKTERIEDMQIFGEVVAVFMQHRRKMLKACTKFASGRLKAVKDWQQIFEQCSINPQHRPEELSAEKYISIANLCSEFLNRK